MNLQPLLDRWNISVSEEEILKMWNAPHRKYHSMNHLKDLLQQIEKAQVTEYEHNILKLVAIFHDIIYDPQQKNNEEQSAKFFLEHSPKTIQIQEIAQMILDTKDHNTTSLLSQYFISMDMSIVLRSFQDLLEWEHCIRHEYSFYSENEYKRKRMAFLQNIIEKYPENSENLERLMHYVRTGGVSIQTILNN